MSASAGRDRKALRLAEKFLPAEYKETVVGVDKLFDLMQSKSSPSKVRRRKTKTRNDSSVEKTPVMMQYDDGEGHLNGINAPFRVRVPRKLVLGSHRRGETSMRATM